MYSDDDGVATKRSQATYDSQIRLLTFSASLLSSLGLLLSFLNADYTGENFRSLSWSNLVWPLIWFHSLELYWKRSPITTYTAALRGSLLCIIVIACKFVSNGSDSDFSILSSPWKSTELVVAFLLAVVQVLFPRRPDIFTVDGKIVDAERSASALSCYSMQWCTAALLLAGKPVKLDDLPVLDYSTRSKSQPLLVMISQKTLWDRIVAERFRGFLKQWSLVIARSVVDFGSPYCLMRLLKTLEQKKSNGAWMWLMGIGVSSTCQTVLHYHLAWIQWSEMGIPIRAQLGMAMFQKALRRKESQDQSAKSTPNVTKIDPVNLISSDVVGLSKFTAVNYIILSSFVRFAFAMAFLSQLLGLKSSLIGMMATILCVPVYTLLIKRQRITQKNLASARDRKARVITEAMHALRQIKFSALETQWQEHINTFRQDELLYLRWSFIMTNIRLVWGVTAPFFVAAASVYAYAYFQGAGNITPSIIFPMMEVLPHLQSTLGFVPVVFQDYFGARSNARRIDEYLRRPEQERILDSSPSGKVSFKDVAVAWPADETDDSREKHTELSHRFSLKNINLDFPVGELSVVSGKTGSGKSLLLAAIIGEADLLSGRIAAPSVTAREGYQVAYVSQTPWLQNDTIKNNILFGSPLDEERYAEVLAACALLPDLEALTNGDETRIGLRGVKLSGGQRARLAFGRALYSRAQLIVLDDIFAALDAHVSDNIFNALTGKLGEGRTRILATHQVSRCKSMTKYTVHLHDNTIAHASGTEFSGNNEQALDDEESPKQKSITKEKPTILSNKNTPKEKPAKKAKKSSARTDLKVYKKYFDAAGGFGFSLLFLLGLVAKQLLNALTTWLLGGVNSKRQPRIISRQQTSSNTSASIIDGELQQHFVLYIWSAVSVIVLEFLFNIFNFSGSMHASKSLSYEMTFRIIRMPLFWIDNTPIGILLKAFTADTRMIDQAVLDNILKFSECIVKVVTVVGVGLYTSMYHGILTVAVLIWCGQVSTRYLRARSLVKAESGPTSDILQHFTACSAGISTIRAFGAVDTAIDQMHLYLDRLSTAKRHFWIFNRWLGLQMSFIGIVFSTGTGIILLLSGSKSAFDISLVGALLTFSMGTSNALFKAVDSFATLETYMEAANSIIGYTELETEGQGGNDVPAEWPIGNIEVRELEIAYSDKLPLVLKWVTFTIGAGQRLGIVGRTGAGKSSVTLALLRLLQPRNGHIYIDGVDISSIKLEDLRSRIAYIPQDPILFSGTVRSNLDYFKQVPEDKLRGALESIKLLATEKDSNLFSLDSTISAGGANISQGQRQLLCLARVLIKNPKIIILDEATSAVDNQTDLLIQQIIKREFHGTLIVVAHRLRTVASFDKVMVMSGGEVSEIGKPVELMRRKGSFYELVQDSQDREFLKRIIVD